MDKLGEFIVGLQTILDSPNPPQNELVRVIQSTHRDFLTSALAISTMTWPTVTHLELVKIVIGMPIEEPAPAAVVANPRISHEQPPLFDGMYFDKLQRQLMAMDIEQLANSDGSWVHNIGFSIEATLMQATRRMDALERLEQLAKSGQGGSVSDMARIQEYCAHVLGSGTLDISVWKALSRMVFTMFYVLPCSTRVVGAESAGENELSAQMARLVVHYGSWLQIVGQMVENHGPGLCRRVPTVIEDPSTKQFKWGIPTLYTVATTELLRNHIMRRAMLFSAQQPSPEAVAAVGWAASKETIAAEEERLRKHEQTILSNIISKDASAVYGMMADLHHLLQLLEGYTKGQAAFAIPGTRDSLEQSLSRTCYGLAPILGFDEQALTQAMDMGKLAECLGDMKCTTLRLYYAPLCGRYPQNTGAMPAYAEHLVLRMATALFNIDQAVWGDTVAGLAPAKISNISQASVTRLTRTLRIAAVYSDVFSLGTVVARTAQGGSDELGMAMTRLIKYSFMRQAYSDELADILHDDTRGPQTKPPAGELVGMGIEWVCEFIQFAQAQMSGQLLESQLAAALQRGLAFFVSRGEIASVVGLLGTIPSAKWQQLASARLEGASSAMGIVWSSMHRLYNSGYLRSNDGGKDMPTAEQWQVSVALSCPKPEFLAYVIAVHCIYAARELVSWNNGACRAKVTRHGINVLRILEQKLTSCGLAAWGEQELLFVPQLYTGEDSGQVEKFAQTQLAEAIKVLSSSKQGDWARQLGHDTALLISERDMRTVACFVTDYASSMAGVLLLLSQGLSGAESDTENPFHAANILARLPPIEAPNSPSACDIDAAVKQWRRLAAQLEISETRRHVQELIGQCWPSNYKHYLEAVVVRFMEAEPAVGVEVVIGSIADHMWKNQIVYARRTSPFYAIRAMFSAVAGTASAPRSASREDDGVGGDDRAARLARSHTKPVFNAVVGGRVRAQADQQMPTTAEREDKYTTMESPEIDVEETVRAPAACLRILVLLTALRYGGSKRDTPIHAWLSDCLDSAPASLQRQYFEYVLTGSSPTFGAEIPVEQDWSAKVKADIATWLGDSRLHGRPMTLEACVGVVKHALRGEAWKERWREWAPVLADTLAVAFAKPISSSVQRDIVRAMVSVPLAAPEGGDVTSDIAVALREHPLQTLSDALTPLADRDALAFADNKDWFLVHVLPTLVETLATNEAAHGLLHALLLSPDELYQRIPWLDVGTSLVQNLPLGKGCPVVMTPQMAKRHFISYVSPLARVLLVIATYVENGLPAEAPLSPTAYCSAEDGGGDNADSSTLDWTFLEECLMAYITSSGDALPDTMDALLDVYTYTSLVPLRRVVEEATVKCCQRNADIVPCVLERAFGKRPLDVFTLHSLRPRQLSSLPPLTPHSGDTEPPFRPAAEVYPFVRRVLLLALDDCGLLSPSDVARAIEDHLWAVSEEPDVRRNLIALKPRLIPKEHRPDAGEKSTSQEIVLQTTSASLHIPAEAIASAAAYALDRSVSLLALLVAHTDEDACLGRLALCLAHSRALLAVLMIAVGDSMRQFATLASTRELLTILWTVADDGDAEFDGTTTRCVWTGINFYSLAQRLNSQLSEEYITWPQLQSMYSK
ncbi:hypothetical protein H4R20_001170 [Coemansia guatemalensis]|uniref:Uncharacterized protein n=1 Tax=Coemansia guatemalensis TaxID=2761395 RepID=A0A9W8I2E7_9FUNG|nr:hypothetical protein H4R20_001170 [Coemansia guatemalensis]